VLDHYNRIPQISEALQGVQQAAVVPLMQSNGGFIKHVQDSCQPGTDLGRQSDPLRFAAR
jgi:hypothetical protein